MKHKGKMLNRMILHAVVAHDEQYDKGGLPYILHPLHVMNSLNTDDEELLCIAVGHDLVEDTETTFQDLYELGFTGRIVSAIDALTKRRGETHYQYKMRVQQNPDAVIVKMADLAHNSDIHRLKGVTEKDIARMVRYHNFFLELKALSPTYVKDKLYGEYLWPGSE